MKENDGVSMMAMEYGSYFPIELDKREEYYRAGMGYKVVGFDCGRSAITAIAKNLKAKKLLIPYYNCDTVRDTLIAHGVQVEYYMLDGRLLPVIDKLGDNEWLIYVNYFGNIGNDVLSAIEKKYKNVIFDNTQGFFTEPINGKDCFNVYSPRKFFGVSDGAYVVWYGDFEFSTAYNTDVSWERAGFLLKSIEVGTNNAYEDNLESMEDFGKEIKHMSVLTHRILASIDYEKIRIQRKENLKTIHGLLKDINEFPFDINLDNDLMIYPFLTRKKSLRKLLVSNHIYVSQWWKYLMDIVPAGSIEYTLSEWLLPLPIDHRYAVDEMLAMGRIVLDCYESC